MPKLSVQVDDDLMKQLDLATEQMSKDPMIQDLGVRVNRGLAARAALVRGLRAMLSGQTETRAVEPKVEPKDKREDKPAPEPKPEDVVAEVDGMVQPPDGWNAWSPARKFPPSQQVLHDYYGSKGWTRMTGKIGVETISFYWSGNKSLHEVEPFPGTDSGGRSVIVQDSPWGPGHIIPPDWGA